MEKGARLIMARALFLRFYAFFIICSEKVEKYRLQ